MPRAKDNPGGSEYSVSWIHTHTHTHTQHQNLFLSQLYLGCWYYPFYFWIRLCYAMLCPITYLHYYSSMQSTWIALTQWNQPPHLSYIEFPFTLGVKGHLPKSSNQLHMAPRCEKSIVEGPLYTRSQGQCSTQIQHSYRCKSWNQPQGFTLVVKAEREKKLFNLPQVTSKCWTLLVPRLQRGYHQIWEANLHPWSNVPAFLNILTSISSIY
jgi:hypothetical protein